MVFANIYVVRWQALWLLKACSFYSIKVKFKVVYRKNTYTIELGLRIVLFYCRFFCIVKYFGKDGKYFF